MDIPTVDISPRPPARPGASLPAAAIDAAVRALDAHDGRRSIGPDEALALRVVKVAEECGEASAALIGLRGQNPRKGLSSEQHLVDELFDVALAALVAAASVSGDWADSFAAHVTARTTRLIAAVDSATGPGPDAGPDPDPDADVGSGAGSGAGGGRR